jgi:drug/metabolite transporter (DMT)-like permease
MILAVFCFSVLNASAKALSDDYSTLQIIVFARILAPVAAVLIAIRAGGIRFIGTQRPFGHLLRGTIALCSVACFLYALSEMTVSKAITINFAAPLFVAVMAIVVLGEKVGPRRWAAIVVGFIGILVIVRPDDGQLDLPSIVAIASAVFYAGTIIMTRRLAITEHSAAMLFSFGLVTAVLPAVALPWVWITPTGHAIGLFMLVAIAGTLAWYLMAEAYKFGEASLIVPLDYTHLIWAASFDFLIWATIPAWTTFAGGTLIVGANLFILWRENQIARRQSRAEPIR